MAGNKEPITWQAHEYVYREKSTDWYWAVGIITVSMAITAILFNNVLFAVFILLAFFILMMYSKRQPELLDIKIDERGIQEGNLRYHYSSIESFWVEDRFGETKLIMKSKKKAMPYITIPIFDVDASEVRNHIKRHVREEEHAEPLAKQIMEYLGF
ncbi:MAG: hypothetical protein Q7S86_03395 [bacterium]|nr:hypothetical protein [bacterium]